MNLIIYNLPDLKEYTQEYITMPITSDVTVLAVFKTIERGDNVIVDFYLDKISENSKIVTGKNLVKNSRLFVPNDIVDFNYYIDCVDMDDIEESLLASNLQKFYLQFTSNDGLEDFNEEFEKNI